MKNKILKWRCSRAETAYVVEHSTTSSTKDLNSTSEPTDIMLYKLATQYSELKRLAGYTNVDNREEYKFLCEEASRAQQVL